MKKNFIFYPFLFSIYPIIYFYAHNVKELLITDIMLPILITIIFAFIFYVTIGMIFKDFRKSSIVIFMFTLVFFFYGLIFDVITKNLALELKHRHVLPTLVFISVYVSYFIYKLRKEEIIINLNKILSVITISLVVANLFIIAPNEIVKIKLKSSVKNVVNSEINLNNQYPDIYYIILDEYASLDTIKKIWGYDNTWFKDELENMGFYVSTNSKSRYTDTRYSIASSLNMEYIDGNEDILKIWQMINNNKVMEYLKRKGYKTIAFDNLYALIYNSKGKMNVDINYDFRDEFQNKTMGSNFSKLIINNSILKPIVESFSSNSMFIEKTATLYTLEKLKEMPYVEGPKFVYAHILCPHVPFVFDENGNDVDPNNYINWIDKKYYREQYIFISKQIRSLAADLIKNSKYTPIIVIQSDHGPRGGGGEHKLGILTEDMKKIFNVYYLPDLDTSNVLYKYISPANTFRLIFSNYFDNKYELLED